MASVAAGPEKQPLVLDVNVFVAAVVAGVSRFSSGSPGWPSPPPVSDNAAADCIGIVNDAREFSLWLSEHILWNVGDVLVRAYGWHTDMAERYVALLVRTAAASGGDVVEPDVAVSDCADHEDNRILELAVAVDAKLIVSADFDLTSMSPWRGRAIVTPREFAARVDAARRARRRNERRR